MDFNLDDSIGYRIEFTERILKRELINSFQKNDIDITPNQWVVLYRLWHKEGLTQAEISEQTFKDKANITRIIDLLVKKNLVERVPDESDRRVYKIVLTDKSRALMKELPQIVDAHIEKAITGISRKDLETAIAVLDKINHNFN